MVYCIFQPCVYKLYKEKITFPLLLELLDKLLNDPSVQFLFDKNRYNLLQSTKVGLKLQPPQVTKDNVDVVEIECDDQLENCHDGIQRLFLLIFSIFDHFKT